MHSDVGIYHGPHRGIYEERRFLKTMDSFGAEQGRVIVGSRMVHRTFRMNDVEIFYLRFLSCTTRNTVIVSLEGDHVPLGEVEKRIEAAGNTV